MKKIINILLASAALLTVLSGCQERTEGDVKVVDLRYRVNDSYDLTATNAQPFTITIASSDPWYIYSEHPEWCIISQEQGAAVEDLEQLHVGKAPVTTVSVQYYNNPNLDDREDRIIIQSDFWIGKKVVVRQKGTAFLTISDEDLDQKVVKGGGEYTIHIDSNQDWSAQVTQGKWLSISDGATGSQAGDITLTAADNFSEMRYASVTIYDRHNKPMHVAKFTQDGIQIEPVKAEYRTFYNDESVAISLKSNAKWTVSKESEWDDWFTIDTLEGEGDGDIQITLTPNEDKSVRSANIILRNVTETEEDVQIERAVVLKQGYQVIPEHHVMNSDELLLWSSDWANDPVYVKDVGTYFDYPCRVNSGHSIGNASTVLEEESTSAPNSAIFVFRWSAITSGVAADAKDQPRVRQWFCFNKDKADKDAEMKVDIRPFDGTGGKITVDFNAAGDGNKPKVSEITSSDVALDWTQAIELWVKFEPNEVFSEYKPDPDGEEVQYREYCKVSIGVNGKFVRSFDTSLELFRTCFWNTEFRLYMGMYNAFGNAICESYDFYAPINWDD